MFLPIFLKLKMRGTDFSLFKKRNPYASDLHIIIKSYDRFYSEEIL